jgi:hypothetical protein
MELDVLTIRTKCGWTDRHNFVFKFYCGKHARRRMPSSEILRRVTLVRTDVSEECIASIIRVITIGDLGTTIAITSNRNTLQLLVTASVASSTQILVALMMEAIRSSETLVFARVI